jgi:hypothetical protein
MIQIKKTPLAIQLPNDLTLFSVISCHFNYSKYNFARHMQGINGMLFHRSENMLFSKFSWYFIFFPLSNSILHLTHKRIESQAVSVLFVMWESEKIWKCYDNVINFDTVYL